MEDRWSEAYRVVPDYDYGEFGKAAELLQQIQQALKSEDDPTPRSMEPSPRFAFNHWSTGPQTSQNHWHMGQQAFRDFEEDAATSRSAESHLHAGQQELASAPFVEVSFAAASDSGAPNGTFSLGGSQEQTTRWPGGDLCWSGTEVTLPRLPLDAALNDGGSHRGFFFAEPDTASGKDHLVSPLSVSSTLKMTETPPDISPVTKGTVPDTPVNGDLGKVCYLTLLEILLSVQPGSQGQNGLRKMDGEQNSEPFAEPLARGDLQKSQVQLCGTAEELQQLRQLLQHCSNNVNEAEMAELRAAVQRQQEELAPLQAECMQLQSNLASSVAECSRLRSFIERSNEQQAEVTELRTMLHRQQALHKDELAQLRAQCAQLQANLSSNVSECSQLRSLLAQSSEQQAASQAGISDLRAVVHRHQEELSQSQGECTHLQSNLTKSQEELSQSQAECVHLQSNLTQSMAECAQLRAFLASSQQQGFDNQQLQAEVAQLKSKLSEQGKQYSEELRKRHTLLEERDTELTASIGSLSNVSKELEEAKKEIDKKDKMIDDMDEQIDQESLDYAKFLKRVVDTSIGPCLTNTLDLRNSELLGMGNYGYVLTCEDKLSKQRVVVKLQSQRWLAVAVKEWVHGDDMRHEHIVEYNNIFCHRDSNKEIREILEQGFQQGTLKGRRPAKLPESYLCLILEYMDRGTVENLIASGSLGASSAAAITQQVASALAFMHQARRTHNDIKPANILLTQAPCGGGHLIAKLADLGLAEYSDDCRRDKNLFAYTIWVMALNRSFEKCPPCERHEECLALMWDAAPAGQGRDTWKALHDSIGGLWNGTLDVNGVAVMPKLRGHKVQISAAVSTELEAAGRADIIDRHTKVLERQLSTATRRRSACCWLQKGGADGEDGSTDDAGLDVFNSAGHLARGASRRGTVA